MVFDLVVIGGGPAGLFGAIRAKELNPRLSVIIMEKMDQCGRKLLVSGGGQCNLTRDEENRELIKGYGSQGRFLGTAFSARSPSDTYEWFTAHGLPLIVREDKKVFPASLRATDVRDLLVGLCEKLHIEIRYQTPVSSIKRIGEATFQIEAALGQEILSRNILLATGGMNCPGTGSSGDGYALAKSLGHVIVPPHPALAAAKATNEILSAVEGVSLERVCVIAQDGRWTGPLLFTRNGVSGPVILDNSRNLRSGDSIRLCTVFRPDGKPMPAEIFSQILMQDAKRSPSKQIATMLHQLAGVPKRLVQYHLKTLGIPEDKRCADISNKQAAALAERFCAWRMSLSFEGAFKTCMATAGGVALSEIDSKTMMSKLVDGLYFAGEVIDIDGKCGGYNLQAAWSTADLVARAISL